MPTRADSELPKPVSWEEFERISQDIIRTEWQDPGATLHGRMGQSQQGVDVYCYAQHLDDGICGFQCKNVDEIDEDMIESEVEKAKEFQPAIEEFIIFTTAPQDASIQEFVRELSGENKGEFIIKLLMWEDIANILAKEQNLLETHYPQFINSKQSIEEQGFQRLSNEFFEENPAASIETCWQTEFRISDIMEYDVRRSIEPDTDEIVSISEYIKDELIGGSDLAIIGTPGSGKSTTCRAVAIRWFESTLGDVLYRDDQGLTSFDDPELVEERLKSAYGEALVVIENAIRHNPDTVFQIIEKFSDDDSVHFLIESRENEWVNLDQNLENIRHKHTKSSEIDVFEVPELDVENYREILNSFRQTADIDPQIDASTLHDDAQSHYDVDESVYEGELLFICHKLSNLIGQNSLSTSSSVSPMAHDIERTQQWVSEEVDYEFLDEVCMTINILNISHIGVSRELIYSIADDGEDVRDISRLMEDLKGRLIFESSGQNEIRTKHPIWSVKYVRRLLDQNASLYANIFELCTNSMLSLFGDTELQDIIIRFLDTDSLVLSSYENKPDETVDMFLYSVYLIGIQYSQLSPLFKSSENSALVLPDQTPNRTRLELLNWRGVIFLHSDQILDSIAEFEQLLERIDEEQLSEDAYLRMSAMAYNNLAVGLERNGEIEDAIEKYAEAKDIYKELDDPQGVAKSLGNLAILAKNQGRLDKAERWHKLCLNLFEKAGDLEGKAAALHNLGNTYRAIGRLQVAETRIEESLDINMAIGNKYGLARNLGSLGDIAGAKGNPQKAKERSLRGKTLFKEIGDKRGLCEIYKNLGLAERDLSEPESARAYFEDGLELAENLEMSGLIADFLIELGKLAKERGDMEEGEQMISEAQEVSLDLGDDERFLRARIASHDMDISEFR